MVVGAGIVGLACASALARVGRSVVVVERHAGIARETTSRNSEVVHAGIYYPAGSLKATLCLEGRRALEARCRERRIPYRAVGKWIVARDDSEVARLEELRAQGTANGVGGLALRTGREVIAAEAQLQVAAGLWSPETGIVDAHALALSHLAEAEECGATLLLRHDVVEPTLHEVPGRSAGWQLTLRGPEGADTLRCAAVVNCSGLAADALSRAAGVDVDRHGLRQHFCKGDYFSLAPSSPLRFRSLVYPLPAGGGLGIHATLDLAGRIRFGPDAEYVESLRYEVAPSKAETFAAAIARYAPRIRAEDLTPDYAGIRPKLAAPGEGFRDFEVREQSALGLPGWVDCIGIESPGLTAAEAIAGRVRALLAAP